MNRKYVPVFSAAIVCLAAIAGCDKKVTLTFVNTTDQSRPLELSAPTAGSEHLGVLPPSGGKVKHTLKINKDDLPATVNWQAGDAGGNFTVDKKTPKEQLIYIREGGKSTAPLPKKSELNETRKKEIKDMPVEQHEVVE